MNTLRTPCEVCFTENDCPRFGDFVCTNCGQLHEYDEGTHVRLSNEQAKLHNALKKAGK